MSAIIWKEIRENLKWAVLWMLGVSVFFLFVLYELNRPYAQVRGSFLNDAIQMIIIVGTTIGASLLGLLQTVPELWRDQWAFLVHRPLSRTRLFFGKAIAAFVLYSMAILLPFFVAATWVSVPGHLSAPFDKRMLLPGFMDFVTGGVFYFAAVLTGVRQARWYVSRAVPFVPAILCSAFAVNCPELWQAAAVTLLTLAVLMTAAWGNFVASGQYGSQPRIAKAALGAVLCVSIVTIGLIGAIALHEYLSFDNRKDTIRYVIDPDGRALRVRSNVHDNIITEAADLAGKSYAQYHGKRLYDVEEDFPDFSTVRSELFPAFLMYDIGTYRSACRLFNMLTATEQSAWYFVPSDGLIYEYDHQSHQCVGTLSPGGYKPSGSPAESRFPREIPNVMNRNETSILKFSTAAYRVDCSARAIEKIFETPPDRPLLGACEITLGRSHASRQENRVLALATAQQILFFPSLSQKPISVPCHYSYEQCPNIRVALLPKGGYVLRYSPPMWSDRTESHAGDHVVLLSAAGEELKRYDLPRIVNPRYTTPHAYALWALVVPIAGLICGFGIKVIVVWSYYGYPAAVMEWSGLRYEMLIGDRSFFTLAAMLWLVGAVIWTLAICTLARRYGFTRRQTIGWAIAGVLLGPAGLVTMLVLRDWPARVSCSSCGRKRLVDRERCEHCGATFPKPEPTGTEIFDEPGVTT